jgi:type VI protein secretion system component VasK
MPWSFSVLLVTFAIFFFSLNVYIVTSLLSHPWASDLWLIGVVVGGIGLLYSIRMLRVHQQQLIEARNEREHQESE